MTVTLRRRINIRRYWGLVMPRIRGRLLIINDQRAFACLVGIVAERLGFAARVLPHTLDFPFLMNHWRPSVISVHMGMPDQQDVEVLEHLERTKFFGGILLTGGVAISSLEQAASVAQRHGLTVTSVLTMCSTTEQIEAALKTLLALQRAA
jgi:hypothetical protein